MQQAAAQIVYPLPISGALGFKTARQYVPGDWEWVILNGGATIYGWDAGAANARGARGLNLG